MAGHVLVIQGECDRLCNQQAVDLVAICYPMSVFKGNTHKVFDDYWVKGEG